MISIAEFYNNFRDKNELHQVLIKENWQIGVMEEFALSYAKEQLSDFINWHNENYTENYIPNSRIGIYKQKLKQ